MDRTNVGFQWGEPLEGKIRNVKFGKCKVGVRKYLLNGITAFEEKTLLRFFQKPPIGMGTPNGKGISLSQGYLFIYPVKGGIGLIEQVQINVFQFCQIYVRLVHADRSLSVTFDDFL